MKLWNYIGEFFLFRWLLGKFSQPNKGFHSKLDSRYSWDESDYEDSLDRFHEEMNDYDIMDDY